MITFLSARLPHFMVPRYIQFREMLPRTPIGKIQKSEIRSGTNIDIWDLKEAPISVRELRAKI